MRNVARLPESDRRELFRNTADKMGLNDAIVERFLGMLYAGLSVPPLPVERDYYLQRRHQSFQGIQSDQPLFRRY